MSNEKDNHGARDLKQSKPLHCTPVHLPDNGNGGSFLCIHAAEGNSFPNLVTVHRTKSKIKENSEETTLGDPADDCKEGERHEHESCLEKPRPSLLFYVDSNLSLDTINFNNLVGGKGPSVKGCLWYQTTAWGQSQDPTGNDCNSKTK